MNKWQIEDEKKRWMDLAHSRIIHLNNWWGYKFTPHEVITELRETIAYMEHIERLNKEEENADTKQPNPNNAGEDIATSGQPKKGAWGLIGAYAEHQGKRDFAGDYCNT